MKVLAACVLAMVMVVSVGERAGAQVVGSFGWQTQPYCNIVTLTVVQQGGLYQLTGSDNQCGAAPAPVIGTAIPSSGGVAMGFTISLGSGQAAHISATVNLATLSGTWFDGDGRTGSFLFGGNTGGSPRPAPASAAAIGVTQLSPTVYAGSGAATTVARSDHTHDDRYYTKSQVTGLLSMAVTGGNGEGTGNTICTAGGVEVFTRNALGTLVDARFSFIIPGYANGQIRGDGSIRTSSANLASVQHPSPGSYCLVFSGAQPSQTVAESTVVSIHAER